MRQAEIGIDHADQRQAGKVVALGDELRADDDVHLAAGDRVELGADPLHAAQHVARQDERARRPGKRSSTSSCSRSTPGPKATRVSSAPQLGQAFGPPLLVAAMMADEHSAKAVLDQPGGAIRARKAMAATAAERQRRVAAAVQEEQRLLARGRSSRRRR